MRTPTSAAGPLISRRCKDLLNELHVDVRRIPLVWRSDTSSESTAVIHDQPALAWQFVQYYLDRQPLQLSELDLSTPPSRPHLPDVTERNDADACTTSANIVVPATSAFAAPDIHGPADLLGRLRFHNKIIRILLSAPHVVALKLAVSYWYQALSQTGVNEHGVVAVVDAITSRFAIEELLLFLDATIPQQFAQVAASPKYAKISPTARLRQQQQASVERAADERRHLNAGLSDLLDMCSTENAPREPMMYVFFSEIFQPVCLFF
jgi:hypothetical protein